ncbi:MAG: hypothetical protein UX04_C0001G0063 [Microgenomates group bacterium GW2011_GWF2_45_18]|nr:MAG: hypothetical protein UW18_C0003G0168 [Microgenomates group bacterium GW2011_GWF1_44_10]KKU02292.1 MAG: hypothetical protein UX04_C0001G0063 [Microgenomates group bacterium GW2011_GWF2_45_18]OGJ41402.1 MAG: hypothetical protein A2378_00750 [Candidatus Pacebacteria bacterium RIFOXYB1_FULL_44_10]HAU99242.1 hypothetical protein [Candidatus Paceibacterota bacterium]HAX01773.1 hypothetical protein [Candidatus Paceibacterota bacterium]
MNEKLVALLPLLGWFYLSLFVIASIAFVFRKYRNIIHVGVLTITMICSSYLIGLSFFEELGLYEESVKSLRDTALSKREHESGSYYHLYHDQIRGSLPASATIQIQGLSTKEMYFARMYAYPVGIDPVATVSSRKGEYALVFNQELHTYPRTRSVAVIDSRTIVYFLKDDE